MAFKRNIKLFGGTYSSKKEYYSYEAHFVVNDRDHPLYHDLNYTLISTEFDFWGFSGKSARLRLMRMIRLEKGKK